MSISEDSLMWLRPLGMSFTSSPLVRDHRETPELFPLISFLELAPTDAIDPLAFSIRRSREDLVAVACIDTKGFLGPCEFYPRRRHQQSPVKLWFSLAQQVNASAVIVALRTKADAQLVGATLAFGKAIGIPVLAFIFVELERTRVVTHAPERLRRSPLWPVVTRSR